MHEKLESQKVKPTVECQSWDSNPGPFDFGAHIFYFRELADECLPASDT